MIPAANDNSSNPCADILMPPRWGIAFVSRGGRFQVFGWEILEVPFVGLTQHRQLFSAQPHPIAMRLNSQTQAPSPRPSGKRTKARHLHVVD